MYIIVIAWLYVIGMMSLTEASVTAGVLTFLLYGVLPVTIITYVMGSGQRKRKRMMQEKQRRDALQQNEPPAEATSEER